MYPTMPKFIRKFGPRNKWISPPGNVGHTCSYTQPYAGKCGGMQFLPTLTYTHHKKTITSEPKRHVKQKRKFNLCIFVGSKVAYIKSKSVWFCSWETGKGLFGLFCPWFESPGLNNIIFADSTGVTIHQPQNVWLSMPLWEDLSPDIYIYTIL